MKISKIRPIPKYMLEKIRKYDLKNHDNVNRLRFYSYLSKNDSELVQIFVAVKYRYNKFYCKQVVVHGLNSKDCFLRDISFSSLAGYRVGWQREGFYHYRTWYDYDWGYQDDKYFNIHAPIINPEYVYKFDEFKYCALTLSNKQNAIKYLRLYQKYPQIEYLVKAGLQNICESTQILKLLNKNKNFGKWLMQNKEKIRKNYYYIPSILTAFKKNLDVDFVDKQARARKEFTKSNEYKQFKNTFDDKTIERIINYIAEKKIWFSLYNDYIQACLYLKLDMTKNKNLFPHDFNRWHDIRIDEMNSKKLIADEETRKEFYQHFKHVATKYLSLENCKKSAYIAIIAQKPSDLVKESLVLHHCVGKMNYDQKMVREESLIFFIRPINEPETPFVTMEYSPSKKKVLQCYGVNNSTPQQEVLDFVNKVWLPSANRKINKLLAA